MLLKIERTLIITAVIGLWITVAVLNACPPAKAKTPTVKVTPPLNIKFGSTPEEVRRVCTDLLFYKSYQNVYSSMECAKKFGKQHANASMMFRFSLSTNKLYVLAAFEGHSKKGKHRRRRSYFMRKYKKIYGKKPKKKNCGYKHADGKRRSCTHYTWEKRDTKFQIVHGQQPENPKLYGIFFVWSTSRSD